MKLLLGSTALAMAFGLGIGLNSPAAAQQLQFACDANDDDYVDAQESKLCTDREFDEIAAGEQVLTEEVLSAKAEGAKGMPKFDEADRNGDGQISREEWVGFTGERFAGATEASGGRMGAETHGASRACSTWSSNESCAMAGARGRPVGASAMLTVLEFNGALKTRASGAL